MAEQARIGNRLREGDLAGGHLLGGSGLGRQGVGLGDAGTHERVFAAPLVHQAVGERVDCFFSRCSRHKGAQVAVHDVVAHDRAEGRSDDFRLGHPDVPAPENGAFGVLHRNHSVAGDEGLGSVDDDVVFGVRGGSDHAAGGHFVGGVAGLPEHHCAVGILHVGRGPVAHDRLELVGSRGGDYVAVGAACGVEVENVAREGVVVGLDPGAEIAEFGDRAALHLDGPCYPEYVGVFVAFPELHRESGIDRGPFGNADGYGRAAHGPFDGKHGVALVLRVVLLAVGDLHLEELVAEGLLLRGGHQVSVIVAVHAEGEYPADVAELERVAAVAGGHYLLVRGRELAVEEAVVQVVRGRGRI